MKQSRWKKADWILLGSLLAAGLLGGLLLFLTSKTGQRVQVRVGGEIQAVYRLEEEGRYRIEGAEGGSNILVIQDGKAWVEEASCPDGLCMHMGKIMQQGQSIVCLPNQVIIEITEAGAEQKVDGVVR
ncbi:MAG: NusG domain II-containing protein [Lachnospiraceae bacterium]|nr:NusG domain II-containing protein [Lachnospiraceae bacterium]